MKRGTGIRKIAIAVPAVALVAALVAAFVARILLPASEVAVLRYAAVAPDDETVAIGDAAVPAERFFLQMRDLAIDVWTCIPPWRVRARELLGIPLPRRAFMVTLDSFDPSLADSVEPVLREFGFRAFAALPRDASPEMVAAARAMSDRGFVSVPDLRRPGAFSRLFGESVGSTVRIGGPRGRTAAFPLRRIDVAGGRQAYGVEVRQDSVDPAFFGTLRVCHAEGRPDPFAVLVYGTGDMVPAAQVDVPGGDEHRSFFFRLPAGIEFPLDVVVYDASRTVWQFGATIPRSAVVRRPGYRVPVVAPDAEILPDSAILDSAAAISP